MFYNYHSISAGSWQIVIQLTMWCPKIVWLKSSLRKLIWKLDTIVVRFIFFTIVCGCWVLNRTLWFSIFYVLAVAVQSTIVCYMILVILVLQVLYFSLLYMSAEFWYYCKSLRRPVITVYSLTAKYILEEI